MADIRQIFKNNQEWLQSKLKLDQDYFNKLKKGQSPEFLWLGCADSRVPANEITGTTAGDMFVHRNIANLALANDFSFLSVLQYAVEALKVNHIIVCGHYHCGGVKAALGSDSLGLIDQWIQNIKSVYEKHKDQVEQISDETEKVNKLVEINVSEQVSNIARTNIVQNAWKERSLQIHGWVFDLGSGKLKDLNCGMENTDQLDSIYKYS